MPVKSFNSSFGDTPFARCLFINIEYLLVVFFCRSTNHWLTTTIFHFAKKLKFNLLPRKKNKEKILIVCSIHVTQWERYQYGAMLEHAEISEFVSKSVHISWNLAWKFDNLSAYHIRISHKSCKMTKKKWKI